MAVSPALRIRDTKAGMPPEYANSPPNGVTIGGSVDRTERIGPTRLASWEWNTAMKRLTPPSTFSSTITSAAPRPDWGRPPGELSTLTMTAAREASTGSPGMPVNGAGGPGWTVVEVDDEVLGSDVIVLGVFLLLEHALRTTAMESIAKTTRFTRWRLLLVAAARPTSSPESGPPGPRPSR